MTKRQKQVLQALITRYVELKKPVSSRDLTGRRGFKVSPATMRNDLVALEKEGYIYQPHTSAGRVPTEQGYRFYVNALLKKPELDTGEQKILKERIRTLEKRQTDIVRTTVQALAELSDAVSFGIEPGKQVQCYGLSRLLQQPEFCDQARVQEIAEFFDDPNSYVNTLTHLPAQQTGDCKVYIGAETHFGRNYTVLISEFTATQGEKGYLALLGPTRMNYERNIPLLRYLSKLISGGLVSIFIFANFS